MAVQSGTHAVFGRIGAEYDHPLAGATFVPDSEKTWVPSMMGKN
jgi:hypothetical protein